MTIIGLYVYAPTTFTTATKIEPIEGAPITAGEVALQPGVYRLIGDTNPVAAKGTNETNYRIVKINTKGGAPDPPLAPFLQYNLDQITAFLQGAGQGSEI